MSSCLHFGCGTLLLARTPNILLAPVAERKLAEMKDAMHVVDENVGGLEEQQAELQRQLAEVQQQITAAKAKRV